MFYTAYMMSSGIGRRPSQTPSEALEFFTLLMRAGATIKSITDGSGKSWTIADVKEMIRSSPQSHG